MRSQCTCTQSSLVNSIVVTCMYVIHVRTRNNSIPFPDIKCIEFHFVPRTMYTYDPQLIHYFSDTIYHFVMGKFSYSPQLHYHFIIIADATMYFSFQKKSSLQFNIPFISRDRASRFKTFVNKSARFDFDSS